MKLVVDANVVISALIADSRSNGSDFQEQDVVKAHSTSNVIDSFDTL